MDVSQEIARRVGELPLEMQEQVLRFVASLSTSTARPADAGTSGKALREFFGSLDAVSARQMTEAIEAECERVDADAW